MKGFVLDAVPGADQCAKFSLAFRIIVAVLYQFIILSYIAAYKWLRFLCENLLDRYVCLRHNVKSKEGSFTGDHCKRRFGTVFWAVTPCGLTVGYWRFG
jgi:hypothetical protein